MKPLIVMGLCAMLNYGVFSQVVDPIPTEPIEPRPPSLDPSDEWWQRTFSGLSVWWHSTREAWWEINHGCPTTVTLWAGPFCPPPTGVGPRKAGYSQATTFTRTSDPDESPCVYSTEPSKVEVFVYPDYCPP